MPSFNSISLFGRGVVFEPNPAPRADQQIAAPGVNGMASLDLGGRGKTTKVTGLLVGTTAADLNAAELLFDSYRDGAAYTLVDNFGNVFPFVKLLDYRPQGRVRRDGKWGFNRPYEALFWHPLG